MTKRQKSILLNFIVVITLTVTAVIGMINLKDWINRSDSLRVMEHLGQRIIQYRKNRGSIPPESYVNGIKASLEGHTQIGKINYRARWINFESTPDEVLAYAEKKYPSSWLSDGYVVLRLGGRVEWIDEQKFEELLPKSEQQLEFEMLRKELKSVLPPLF